MKITCSGCDARYSVKDERIAGRSVKIRCKRCGEPIVARGPTAAPALEIFVLVGDDRRGPLTEHALQALIASGDVDGATLTWHADLSDWTPLCEVRELAALAFEAVPPTSAFASTSPSARASTSTPASETSPFDVAGDDASPFAAADVGASRSPAPLALPSAPTTGARNESSVLFSLANLQDLATGGSPRRPQPAPRRSEAALAATTEGSGLIDIRALTASLASSAPRASLPTFDLVLSVGGPIGVLGSPLAAPVIASPPSSHRRGRTLTVLAALAAVTALALGSVALASLGRAAGRATSPTPIVAVPEAPGPAPEPGPAPGAPDPADGTETIASDGPESTTPAIEAPTPALPTRPRTRPTTATAPSPEPTRAPHAEPAVTTPPIRPASSGAPTLEDLMRGSVHTTDGATEAADAATPRLPETPSRDAVRAAMEALAPAVRTCAAGEHGRALVSVVVGGATGRGRSATVGGDFAGTAEGSCIAGVVRGVELEPFARTTFTIAYPFAL